MRARYDENGKLLGFHNMVFDDIPDDYQMKTIFPNIDLPDLSFLGVIKYLRDIKAAKEKLMNSAQQLFSKMYEQAQAQQGGAGPDMGGFQGGNGGSNGKDDNVVDGDYREI